MATGLNPASVKRRRHDSGRYDNQSAERARPLFKVSHYSRIKDCVNRSPENEELSLSTNTTLVYFVTFLVFCFGNEMKHLKTLPDIAQLNMILA